MVTPGRILTHQYHQSPTGTCVLANRMGQHPVRRDWATGYSATCRGESWLQCFVLRMSHDRRDAPWDVRREGRELKRKLTWGGERSIRAAAADPRSHGN